jgi:hypothetical protein
MTRQVMENRRGRLEQCLRNGGRRVTYCTKHERACTDFFNDSNCYITR